MPTGDMAKKKYVSILMICVAHMYHSQASKLYHHLEYLVITSTGLDWCKMDIKLISTWKPEDHYISNTINTLRLRQDGRYFADAFFKMHFLEWKCVNFA